MGMSLQHMSNDITWTEFFTFWVQIPQPSEGFDLRLDFLSVSDS